MEQAQRVEKDARLEFVKALVKVQAVLKPAMKGSVNKHLNSTYSDIADVWEAAREPLTQNGFAVVQELYSEPLSVKVKTVLMHEAGYSISNEFWLPVPKPNSKVDAQGQALSPDPKANDYGAVMSLGRKFGLAAIVGIVSEDAEPPQPARQPQRAQSVRPPSRPAPQQPEPPANNRPHQPVKFRYGPKKLWSSFDPNLTEDELQYYIKATEGLLADPTKAENHSQYALELANLQSELRWRHPPV